MLFELDRVSCARGGEQVLRDLTLAIPEGASAIVGPSGSGKSTVLRLLARLADPDEGTVLYREVDLRERDPLEHRREVCLVPQLPALLNGSIEDNIRFAADLCGREPDVGRLLELSGLDRSFAERESDRLSVGEAQRAMLARALALEPKVLLLDEPTSALDADAKAAIEATVAGLRDRLGISIVLVTHEEAQAERLASWVGRVEDGRAVESGGVSEVLT